MSPKVSKQPRPSMALPEDDAAFIRLPDVLRVFPVGESSWHRGVKSGRYPKPVKLGPRTSAWRVGEIRDLLETF